MLKNKKRKEIRVGHLTPDRMEGDEVLSNVRLYVD